MREGIISFYHAGYYKEQELDLFVEAGFITAQDKTDLLAGKL